ncbi:hypothetical protein EXN66_Car006022 [Channa argus]|uniref:Uncharacterized protein n=1 Tax=Channa argus TaxID=215402 RepID=A0A6G1PJ71_CHAAH|nr:hypothetical protein EXN66_Car006022 [Channa argus]
MKLAQKPNRETGSKCCLAPRTSPVSSTTQTTSAASPGNGLKSQGVGSSVIIVVVCVTLLLLLIVLILIIFYKRFSSSKNTNTGAAQKNNETEAPVRHEGTVMNFNDGDNGEKVRGQNQSDKKTKEEFNWS